MDKLTKENFWNELYAKHPGQMKKFCDWIDEYKERIDWRKLFFTPHATHARDIKYHDLPIAMQIGIFLQFVAESDSFDGIEIPHIKSMLQFNRIPEYIKDFFAYESAIQTHHSSIQSIRLQSDAAEAQNSDQADIKGADGRGDPIDEEREKSADVGDTSRTERPPVELPEADPVEDGKTTVLKDLEERVQKHGHTSAIESAADDIVALQFELEQSQEENQRLKDRIDGYSGAAVFDGDL